MYYPGSERVEECARTFGELADIYYHMPCQKESFSKQDIEEIFEEVTRNTCSGCQRFSECWKKQALRTYQKMYDTLEQMENGQQELLIEKMESVCIFPEQVVQSMSQSFRNMRMKMYYTNQLLENREAVADQLWEMSHLLDDLMEDVFRTSELEEPLNKKICRLFDRRGIWVKQIFLMQKRRGSEEIYITMEARKGECVPMKDLAGILSVVLKRHMVPARESRAMAGYEEETILFVEEPKYQMRYGVSRTPKKGEIVSGDSFSYMQNDQGEAVMCLSDGMGSGAAACAQSERLVELLEQFLEAGVGKETAIRLINSTAVYERKSYSTLDVCSVDLYSGFCEMRKLGAAPTFLYRDGEVEVVSALRVPVGLFHHLELEVRQCRLMDGDYLIMITDGVLEALDGKDKEERFAKIIREQTVKSPKELSSGIMGQLLEECEGDVRDDMTVYVAGIWQKA